MTPKFTILAQMGVAGQPGVEQLRTDLLLLTKLSGTDLGPGPRAVDQSLNGLISRKMEEKKFTGQLGRKPIVIKLDPEQHEDCPQGGVVLVGIGSSSKFDCKAAQRAFGQFIDRALELGVEHVTIPFPARRLTGSKLNLMYTAHCLKQVVERKLKDVKEPKLKEVVLFCTPHASGCIRRGLKAPIVLKDDCCDESK